MRSVCWILMMIALVSTDLVRADERTRRTTRVASATTKTEVAPAPTEPALKPSVPSPVSRPARTRQDLLEPSLQQEGVGRGMVACFQVQADQAELWQLVVRETRGPVAQIFEGQGPPPSRIPWDGRLLDGGLAWSGMTYVYDLAYVDSSGAIGESLGTEFTLPPYSHEDRQGMSFLIPGHQLTAGPHGDPVAAATAGLESAATRLNDDRRRMAVRIEVLARDEAAALALGEAIHTALAAMLEPGDRTVDLYVGAAAAAPVEGTVLITTAPLTMPAS